MSNLYGLFFIRRVCGSRLIEIWFGSHCLSYTFVSFNGLYKNSINFLPKNPVIKFHVSFTLSVSFRKSMLESGQNAYCSMCFKIATCKSSSFFL